jgi:hypothetical protein
MGDAPRAIRSLRLTPPSSKSAEYLTKQQKTTILVQFLKESPVEPAVTSSDPARRSAGYSAFVAQLLSDRERLFLDVVAGTDLGQKLRYVLWTLAAGAAFYGLTAGAYGGALQAGSAAVKLPVLILGSFAICFPAFFVVQILVGSRLRLLQMLVLSLAAPALTAVLLAAFVPITVFFLVTGANYYFLELLHVGLVLVAGVIGVYALHEGLTLVCEKAGVYPRKALTIMRAWALLFAFVSIQMAWNLRPFLGDRGEPFRVFRHYEGNFYAAVIYSARKLVAGEGKGPAKPSGPASPADVGQLLQLQPDTVADSVARKR